MRVFRFRAWSPTAKKMFYQENQYLASFLRRFVTLETGAAAHESYLKEDIDKYLMQYSGIKDKHGKEVYEGDILTYRDEDGDEQLWPVTFEDGCFVVNGSAIWDYLRYDKNNQPTDHLEAYLEVAGNIYENKELV
jgi:uncharacterized phage protein (TIGR01671 family)